VGSSEAGRKPVGPIAPLAELQPGGLEGVGLDHLGARLEHGLVDGLDHVRAGEHERLVALALQAAVVLRGEVELLERRPHAPVEDHDAGIDGLHEIAHPKAIVAATGKP
jgi:hypothetical protein